MSIVFGKATVVDKPSFVAQRWSSRCAQSSGKLKLSFAKSNNNNNFFR